MSKTYAKGIYFNKLPDNTPDTVKKWKKGGISIHVDMLPKFIAEIRDKANEKGYLKFDLTLNEKDGEKFYSFVLNDWKPEQQNNDSKDGVQYSSEDVDLSLIPF